MTQKSSVVDVSSGSKYASSATIIAIHLHRNVLEFGIFNLFNVIRYDFIAICIFVFQFKTLFSFVSVTDIYRRHISSINTAYIIIRRQFFSVFNPLIHNVAKWSDKLEKSCSFFCCKIFKVYLTILVHYALKG